jgi:hypothetical protein
MQAQTIKLNPDDELARRLSQQDAAPIFVEANGVRFRVIRDMPAVNLTDDPFAAYDEETVRAGLKASAGAFKGIDTEALKRDIWEAREQDTPGRPA